MYNEAMANHNSYTRSFYINGEMLRSILKCKHITQLELANQIGVGKNTINRAINLNRMESKNDFDRMCQFLDVSPYLLIEKNPSIGEGDYFSSITSDNVGDFLSYFDYDNYERQLFSDVYIHQFLKNNTESSEYLGHYPNIEKFIFEKVIEKRDEYVELFGNYFFEKMLSQPDQDMSSSKPYDLYSDFVKYFNSHK